METRREVVMRTIVALVVCAVIGIATGNGRAGAARGGSNQEPQQTKAAEAQSKAEEKQPANSAEAAKSGNPVKVTAESLALGKKFYGTDCELCHGKEGAGDGDTGVELKLNAKDLRDPTVQRMTDAEMYKIISKGLKPMLGEEGRLNERETWNLVNYVRSLGKSKT
jgi:mono/diheme cytochrome c family protein